MRQSITVPIFSISPKTLLIFFSNVIDRLKGNAHFPALPIPMPELEAKRDAFSLAITSSIGGGVVDRQMRDQLELEVRDVLRVLAYHVRQVSKGNGVMLASSGFPLRKAPEPILEMGIPANVVARSTFQYGTVKVRWGKVRGVRMYRLEKAEGDPSLSGTVWSTVGLTGRQSMEVSSLEQYKEYFFRVVAVGNTAEGKASDVVMGRAV
jgi:hypothetical protein